MLKEIKKAIAGAFFYAAGTTGLSTVLEDGKVTIGELLTIVVGTPLAGWTVWKVRNQPAPVQATVQDDGL
jgi:hypothetical protein